MRLAAPPAVEDVERKALAVASPDVRPHQVRGPAPVVVEQRVEDADVLAVLHLDAVPVVIASSFERIRRTNLIAMGVLPLLLRREAHPSTLAFSPGDAIEVYAPIEDLTPRTTIPIRITRSDGSRSMLDTVAAVETGLEVDQLAAGGLVPLILGRIGVQG